MDTSPLTGVYGISVHAKSMAHPTGTARATKQDAAPVDPTQLPAPIKGLGIAPLEMSVVGDNDDVPRPPEPPRDLATQALPWQPEEDDGADAPKPPDDEVLPHPQPDLARAVQALISDEATPTVDIRR